MSSSTAEALALLRAGRGAEAETLLREALARGSADAQAVHLLGFVLATSGRVPEGLPLIDRSIALDPRNPGFLVNRAQVLLHMGLLDEAARDASAATAIEPRLAEGWLALAHVLRRLGRARESLDAAERALAASPGHAGAQYHAALLRMEGGDRAGALQGFARVLEREPRHVPALNNLAILLREEGRDAEALEAFARAGMPESLANAAGLAIELERLDAARDLYARAAAARPGYANAEYGLGQVALRERRFAEGWDGYERRFGTDPPQAEARAPDLPRLSAENLARARRVALWQEQGLGDQILFTTLLPELGRRSIGAVVEVDARLLPMYRRSLPAFEFATVDESARAFAQCDLQLPLGSLPALFRRDERAFEGQPAALLQADPARVEAMRGQIAQLGHGAPVAAVSWRSPQGGARRFLGERKSLAPEALASLDVLRGVRLLDLQYGDVDEERRAFEARQPGRLVRITGLDTRNDLEGVAAALVACGRLVTVSNATAHLAGALGVPTELLLPRGWPPFSYWAAERRGRSLWYPSVRIVAHGS